jgi:hypothetical protein
VSGLDAGVAHVDELAARLAAGMVSFAADGVDGEVVAMLETCRAPGGPPADGAWARAREGLDSFLRQFEDQLGSLAVERSAVATAWVGWGGSGTVVLRTDARPAEIAPQLGALRARAQSRLRLLRLLTATVTAAVRVSTRLALPGGAALALPVVFHYLRTLADEAG